MFDFVLKEGKWAKRWYIESGDKVFETDNGAKQQIPIM